MGVYIDDMKMPESCMICEISQVVNEEKYCPLTHHFVEQMMDRRDNDCPLREVDCVQIEDCISKQAVLDTCNQSLNIFEATERIKDLSPVQPTQEVKPISYQDCANAMLMMWMDKVLTDGEYYKIMDKLNAHEKKMKEGE